MIINIQKMMTMGKVHECGGDVEWRYWATMSDDMNDKVYNPVADIHTIACSILLSMATTLAPEALWRREEEKAISQHIKSEHWIRRNKLGS